MRAPAALVVALEHLVDEDPEALVERRLARDPEDARELVLQRARPVGLDVRGAEQQARRRGVGRNASSEGSSRAAIAAARARASRSASSSSSSSELVCEDLALLRRSRACSERGVDPRQRVGDRLALGPLDERRELEQLEVAHDAVGDVEVGVEAQLAQAPADARDVGAAARRAALVKVACSVSSGPKSSSSRSSHSPPSAARASSANGDGVLQRAARRSARRRPRTRPSRARVIATCSSRRISATCAARVSGGELPRAAARRGSARPARRRAPGIRADCRPSTKTWRNSRPCAACIAITQTAPWRPSPARLLVVVQARPRPPRPRSGRTRAPSPAARGARRRRPARRGARALTSRSTTSAWAAKSCWRRSPRRSMRRWTKRSGRVGVERAGGRAVELEEAEDALARLGRQLRRLGRGDERADHVELAPARDLHAAREVDRAQLDRRARQRAHDGAGVAGVDEQPQPGEHVA